MKKLLAFFALLSPSIAFAEIVVKPDGSWEFKGGGCTITNPSPNVIKIYQGAICISIDSRDYAEPLNLGNPDISDK